VFGGFVDGSRVNETALITRDEATKAFCGKMCSEGGDIPARAGHSTVCSGGNLYTFGGQDDDNNKLDDVWCFDTAANSWSCCEQGEGDLKPTPRCGHTAVVAGGKMFVFGGILELTKELNDFCIFDIASGKWEQAPEMIGGEDEENKKSESNQNEPGSPLRRAGTLANPNMNASSPSPSKRNTTRKLPGQPMDLTMPTRKRNQSPSKKKVSGEGGDEKKDGLSSPTSISM